MNRLSLQKRTFILRLLTEGNSIRATGRLADVSKDTVLKLLVDMGTACGEYQNHTFKNLQCKKVQVDEIWEFIHAKNKRVTEDMPEDAGNVWTWVAIDADTRLVPCWHVGDRTLEDARKFMLDLASRMANKIYLMSDGFGDYPAAVEEAFGIDVNYGMVIKQYDGRGRYKGVVRKTRVGDMGNNKISTSYIERQNLTMRMGISRFHRRAATHSKKLFNHECAIALHFMHYNFCRIHSTLRITPAMAAGVSDHVWGVEEILALIT